MCLLLLGIGIIGVIAGALIYDHTTAENTGCIISVIGGLVALVVLAILTPTCASASTVDARIEMYQEENTKIEEQIAVIVKQYQEYEKDIFTEVTPESAMTLVSLYPELKSDSLVSSQIDIYVKNNEKLTTLKAEKINAGVIRWWIYFG